MRFLAAICLLLTSSAFAAPIPARDPFPGESRPTWWWDIWHGRVVVLEGKITFKESEKPDIRIEINKERIKDIIPDDKRRELQSKLGDYYVGELEISKFHYADGGASDSDGTLQQMRSGDLKKVKILIPIMKFGKNTKLYGMNLQPDNENLGIHVLDYGNLMLGLHLVHSTIIPEESLADAKEVFQLREALVHCGTNRLRNSAPDRGYAGFTYHVLEEAVSVGHVLGGSPAHLGGLREGDKIVSINEQSISDPNNGTAAAFQKTIMKWKVGNQITLDVQRGEERRKVEFTLIPSTSIKDKNESEQDDAAQPATNSESKSAGKEEPKLESKVRPR